MISLLSCHNLAFSYSKNLLLSDINIDFKQGEFVALIGANGVGKSTLLQLLLGLIKPQQGAVLLNGTNISQQKRRDIAKKMAFVPQSIELPYAFTVEELVAMGRNPYLGAFELESDQDKALIDDALDKTHLHHIKNRTVNTLSGGERQRVIIARALAQQSDTILLDEPIASLDICHQIETLELIKSLTQSGKLAITALHDLNFAAQYCDRILLIGNHPNNAGQTLVADGSPKAVLTPDNLSTYFSIYANLTKVNNKIQLNDIAPVRNQLNDRQRNNRYNK
jgi:iron complex transport system ATP-binding protein